MNKTGKLLFVIGILMICSGVEGAAMTQSFQVQHQEPTFIERNSPVELSFEVPGIDANDIEEAYLFYRPEGDMGYSQIETDLVSSNNFNVELSVEDEQASSLEYYFQIQLKNGESITYPRNQPPNNPIRVEVIDKRENEREKRVEETGVDYTILSPDPGNTVAKQDVVIALTLFYDPAEIDTANSSFLMMVNGEDVTEQAHADDYFYTYSPDDLPDGTHTVEFKIQKQDTVQTVVDWQFSVLDPNRRGNRISLADEDESWMPEGNIQLSARDQQVGGNANDALSSNVRLSGRKGDVTYSAYGRLTTQEDPRLQPQNRFGATLYIGDWLELEAGHVYPTLNPMTISGQRMQGINAGLHIWDDALNMQFVYGKLRRAIDNRYQGITVDTTNFQNAGDPVFNYSLNTEDGGNGTYARDVIGGRLGLGRDNNFNFGLNFLKVEDDTGSIRVVNDFNSLMETNPDLTSNLDEQHMQELQQNPEQLSVNGNPRPKGNFVAATDLKARFDNNRIQLETDAAISLLNRDISKGVLDQETAEDLGLSIDPETENMLDRLSWLIIINENMETLPIRFDTGSTETTADVFFPNRILATQSELGFNYLNNNLQFRYRWVGPSYNSLANTTIRKDIAGFTLSDRIQLFQNRIYLTLRYERLRDNVVNAKDATTNTNTYRTNVSWYPISQELPRVSVGFMMRNRDNNVDLNNPVVAEMSGVQESAAVRNLSIQNGDTLVTANPRLSDSYQFTASVTQEFSLFGISHDANLNYSMINTKDRVFNYGDANSNNFSMRVVNRFSDLPMQTKVGFNINNTETTNGLTDIQIVGGNIGGEFFLLDDKLSLDMAVALTKNRTETTSLVTDDNGTPQETEDDFYKPATGSDANSLSESNSFIIRTGARYNLDESHSFLLRFRYSNVQNTLSSSRVFPNDHLLQAQYTFNF